jgi:hypothetical protein
MSEQIEMGEHEYRVHVVRALSRLEILAQSTDEHLKRLNGTVAKHEDRLNTLWKDVTEHPIMCPLRAEVEKLQRAVLVDETRVETTEKWWTRASPLIWLAIGGLLVLFLVHAKDILPLVAGHPPG